MSFDMTWEIGVLMNAYADKVRHLDTYREKEALEELYAQAIELTLKDDCGITMPIDECIDWVKTGFIIDYDGHGYLLDKDGEEIDYMCCDTSFLEKAKENGACFVAWYNK